MGLRGTKCGIEWFFAGLKNQFCAVFFPGYSFTGTLTLLVSKICGDG